MVILTIKKSTALGFFTMFHHVWITIWLFNIAMENGPFIDCLPIKNGGSFHGYVSHIQMVNKDETFNFPCVD